jgi:SSS family solute:Na+ symporter
MIVLGFAPLVFLGLKSIGGWDGLVHSLAAVATSPTNPAGKAFAAGAWTQSWAHMNSPAANPMGVEWFGMVFGLGFVLSFGYWCTDFLVVQRAMAADSMSAARRTPLIAAFPKMLFPALVILPGMIAIGIQQQTGNFLPKDGKGAVDYNMTIPVMLAHFFPSGLLGVGITALMASFMSGMAGNVTAFNTVWTYDIYQSYIRPGQPDQHYLRMGHIITVVGILISVACAYVTRAFDNIMDMLQLVFGFVNAPLFATFLLGMFWRRTTGHGAFFGLLAGTLAAALHHGLTLPAGALVGIKGGWLCGPQALHTYPVEMAQNFWAAIYAFTTCFVVTVVVSLATPRNKTDDELRGLVYSLTPRVQEHGVPWFKQPAFLGVIVLAATLVLNLIFW